VTNAKILDLLNTSSRPRGLWYVRQLARALVILALREGWRKDDIDSLMVGVSQPCGTALSEVQLVKELQEKLRCGVPLAGRGVLQRQLGCQRAEEVIELIRRRPGPGRSLVAPAEPPPAPPAAPAPERQGQVSHTQAVASPPQARAAKHEPAASALPEFPAHTLVGSLGDLAGCLAGGTEVPEAFCFAVALTMMGGKCCTRLQLQIGTEVEPRLYTVLVGESYEVRKSSALRHVVGFFEGLLGPDDSYVLWGAGSAEGLARTLAQHSCVVLACDELSAFISKANIKGATLAQAIASLFEQDRWDNATRHAAQSISVRDAHLSLVGCCTLQTWEKVWTQQLIAIGLPNRFLLVGADRKTKVAWFDPPEETDVAAIRERIDAQLRRLPMTVGITSEAKQAWARWYDLLPSSEHTKRLETIGFRLLPLIALTTDQDCVSVGTVKTVCAILDYELRLRMLLDPIDADNTIAHLEEKIRRVLTSKGPMTLRDLRRAVHGDREGLWAFRKALENVRLAGDVNPSGNRYEAKHA
jgi:hypothetical protein